MPIKLLVILLSHVVSMYLDWYCSWYTHLKSTKVLPFYCSLSLSSWNKVVYLSLITLLSNLLLPDALPINIINHLSSKWKWVLFIHLHHEVDALLKTVAKVWGWNDTKQVCPHLIAFNFFLEVTIITSNISFEFLVPPPGVSLP